MCLLLTISYYLPPHLHLLFHISCFDRWGEEKKGEKGPWKVKREEKNKERKRALMMMMMGKGEVCVVIVVVVGCDMIR